MKTLTTIITLFILSSSAVLATGVYAPLFDSKHELVGLCSAELLGDDVRVSARANKLPTHSAFSAWIIPRDINGDSAGPLQHIDGNVTGSDKNYNFIGVGVDLASVYSLVIDIRDHGKPDVDNLIDQVATPGGGCDGRCPTVGLCELVLDDL